MSFSDEAEGDDEARLRGGDRVGIKMAAGAATATGTGTDTGRGEARRLVCWGAILDLTGSSSMDAASSSESEGADLLRPRGCEVSADGQSSLGPAPSELLINFAYFYRVKLTLLHVYRM